MFEAEHPLHAQIQKLRAEKKAMYETLWHLEHSWRGDKAEDLNVFLKVMRKNAVRTAQNWIRTVALLTKAEAAASAAAAAAAGGGGGGCGGGGRGEVGGPRAESTALRYQASSGRITTSAGAVAGAGNGRNGNGLVHFGTQSSYATSFGSISSTTSADSVGLSGAGRVAAAGAGASGAGAVRGGVGGEVHAVYTVSVTTSSIKHAGTDANIEMDIIGVNGMSSGALKLERKGVKHKELFEGGSTDTFKFSLPFLGPIKHIVLRSDNRKAKLFGHRSDPEWHCESVQIEAASGDISMWTIPVNAWLGKKPGMTLQRVFYPQP